MMPVEQTDHCWRKPIVWTIAGSDSCSGAGLQSDLLTFKDFNVHGCCVVTLVTAQHPSAVEAVALCDPAIIEKQIEALQKSLSPRAIKLGALGDEHNIRAISHYLKTYSGIVICDPVLQATSGGILLAAEATESLKNHIFPYATLITPNILEAEALLGMSIQTSADMEKAAHKFLKRGAKNVLIKGGHLPGVLAQDYFLNSAQAFWLNSPKQGVASLHGTGCTLSAAIAAAVALDHPLPDAVVIAKMYLNQAIRHSYCLGGDPIFLARNGWPNHGDDLPWISFNKNPDRLCFPRMNASIGFYPIVDSYEWVQTLLSQGVKTIQLRLKNKSSTEIKKIIEKSVACAKAYDAYLFINDYWEWAVEYGAYGVHLGQSDLLTADLAAIQRVGLRLGVSTHSFYEVARAHALQPSYVAYGPIYHTTSKIMPFLPQGLEKLRYWKNILPYPIVAIGGITLTAVKAVLQAGADGVAVMSAVKNSSNVEQTVRDFLYAT